MSILSQTDAHINILDNFGVRGGSSGVTASML